MPLNPRINTLLALVGFTAMLAAALIASAFIARAHTGVTVTVKCRGKSCLRRYVIETDTDFDLEPRRKDQSMIVEVIQDDIGGRQVAFMSRRANIATLPGLAPSVACTKVPRRACFVQWNFDASTGTLNEIGIVPDEMP